MDSSTTNQFIVYNESQPDADRPRASITNQYIIYNGPQPDAGPHQASTTNQYIIHNGPQPDAGPHQASTTNQFIIHNGSLPPPKRQWLNTEEDDAANRDNICMRITELPGDCNINELCTAIRGCGKLQSISISPAKFWYPHAAAYLSFWNTRGVKSFKRLVKGGNFLVRGQQPLVKWNGVNGESRLDSVESRMVIVAGHPIFVTLKSLTAKFPCAFSRELQNVYYRPISNTYWEAFFVFCSVDEAIHAHMSLNSLGKVPGLTAIVFGDDPCDEVMRDGRGLVG